MRSLIAVALLFIPVALTLRPQVDNGEENGALHRVEAKQTHFGGPILEEADVEEPLLSLFQHVEAEPTYATRADAGQARIAVNPGAFALLQAANDTERSKVVVQKHHSVAPGDAAGGGDVAVQRPQAPAAPSQAHASGAKRAEGVTIPPKFIDYLFHLIDADHGEDISPDEWKKMVKGPWAPLMWPVLDKNGDGKVTADEFRQMWDPAVDKAFAKLGGEDDGKIDAAEIDKLWKDAAEYEKAFVKGEFLEDGHVDGAEFEEFMYTAMVFHAMDPNGDGNIIWDEVKGNAVALAAFGGIKAQPKFDAYFGKNGAQLDELYKLFNQNKVFIPDSNSTP